MKDFFFIITRIIGLINLFFIFSIIFIERKKPETAISWILVLLFLPIIGFITYMLFGETITLRLKRKLKRKVTIDEIYGNILHKQLQILKHDSLTYHDKEVNHYSDMIEMILKQNNSVYTQNNQIITFTKAQEKYNQLLEDIRLATSTIHIMYFIFRDDCIGNKIIDELVLAVKRGVQVRLCYDAVGNLFTSSKMYRRLKEVGGQVQKYTPPFLILKIHHNYCNHRKIIVIDGKIGYTGGMNIGDEYCGEKKLTPWRDTHLRIQGNSVYYLQSRFLLDWFYLGQEKLLLSQLNDLEFYKLFFPSFESFGTIGMQIVSSGPNELEQEIKNGYLKMIHSAKKYIYIQTPYFIPDESMILSLKLAALSGIDVRITIPLLPDKKYVYWATLDYAFQLMKFGVKFYRYQGFIHSKSIVVDDCVTSIGTANFDIRSFTLNFEINAFIYDSNYALEQKEIFLEDLENSQKYTIEFALKRPLYKKILSAFARILSPIM